MEANLKDFLSWIEEVSNRLDTTKSIAAYDYETNGVDVTSEEFYVTIIGLSVASTNKEAESRYIVVDTLSEEDRDTLYNKFEEFVSKYKSKLYAYNASYEMKVNSVIFKGSEVYEIKDTLVLATMVGKRTNLKELAVQELGVEEWSDVVSDIVEAYKKVFDYISKPTYKKQVKKLEDEGKEIDRVELLLSNKRIREVIEPIIEIMGKDQFDKNIDFCPYAWSAVPRDILGKYCSMDSEYTARLTIHLLYNFFNPKLADKSKVGLAIEDIMARRKSFSSVYMPNIYTSVYFELYGPRWKDEEAIKFTEEYYPILIDILYNIIQKLDSISLDDKMKCRDYYIKEVPFQYEVVKVNKKGKETKKVVSVETIEDKLELLKSFFNPNSNTNENRALFFDTYMTPRLKDAVIKLLVLNSLGTIKDKVKETVESSSRVKTFFDSAEENIDFIINDTEAALRGLDWSVSKLIKSTIDKIKGNSPKQRWDRFDTFDEMNFRLAAPVIKFHYEAMTKFLGVDIDDKSTWLDETELLFNIFLYKKIAKTISTNINGSLGRESVYVTKFEGSSIPKRIGKYKKDAPELVLNNSFNPLAAATHRWTAGWHTIPPLSPIRPAITTWSDDEIWVHIDYSQNELVMLAFYSQDENMLNAFYEGADLHRFVASLVFNKSMEEVTSAERRMSKAVSFAIVYGSSITTVAINITNGDVKKAEGLFRSFYDAFPRIKEFMDSKNQQALIDRFNPKVTNMFGGIINLDIRGSDESAVLRQSVNYPIQSASSLLAAVGIKNAIDNFKEKRLHLIPFGFTHDAFDNAIKVSDIFESLDLLKYSMQDQLRDEFKVPMKVDIEVGSNSGWLCELEYTKKDGYYEVEVEGIESHINALTGKFKKYFDLRDYEVIEENISKGSYKPMFTTGTALEHTWITDTITKKKVEFKLSKRNLT